MFKYRRKKYPRLQITNRQPFRLCSFLLLAAWLLTFLTSSCQIQLSKPEPTSPDTTTPLVTQDATTIQVTKTRPASDPSPSPSPAKTDKPDSTGATATAASTGPENIPTGQTDQTTNKTSQASTATSAPTTGAKQPVLTESPGTTDPPRPTRPPVPPTTRKTVAPSVQKTQQNTAPATPTPPPVLTKPPVPPAATATPSPAPTATPAASASFPATNYGTFFRDQYGGNSQVSKSDDGAVLVDTGSTANGVVLVKVDGIAASKQVKAIVAANKGTYQYDIVDRGRYVGLPLQLGNGSYTLTIYEQVAGTSYVAVMALDFSVALASSLKPYTAASIISDFSRSSKAVSQAASLCKGISSQDGKVNAVYNWIASNITYDTALASNITKNKSLYETYLPNPDKTMSSRKGICFDYASLMCAMLRSQGIPTRLVKGTTPLGYHAWNEVYFKGKGWVVIAGFRLVEINGSSWVLLDTTWAAAGWSPEKIKNTAHNKQRVY